MKKNLSLSPAAALAGAGLVALAPALIAITVGLGAVTLAPEVKAQQLGTGFIVPWDAIPLGSDMFGRTIFVH